MTEGIEVIGLVAIAVVCSFVVFLVVTPAPILRTHMFVGKVDSVKYTVSGMGIQAGYLTTVKLANNVTFSFFRAGKPINLQTGEWYVFEIGETADGDVLQSFQQIGGD